MNFKYIVIPAALLLAGAGCSQTAAPVAVNQQPVTQPVQQAPVQQVPAQQPQAAQPATPVLDFSNGASGVNLRVGETHTVNGISQGKKIPTLQIKLLSAEKTGNSAQLLLTNLITSEKKQVKVPSTDCVTFGGASFAGGGLLVDSDGANLSLSLYATCAEATAAMKAINNQ